MCMLMMYQTRGGALERVQIFILAEGLNWHYQVEKAAWCKHFVNLVYTFTLPIHLTRRFVIQGCPTLQP